MYKTIKKVYKMIENIEKVLIGALFLILCATIFYVIVNRNLGGQGLTWLEEFSRSTLIVTTYICGCVAVGEGKLTRLSLVPEALPKRAALLLDAFTSLISFAFMYPWLWVCSAWACACCWLLVRSSCSSPKLTVRAVSSRQRKNLKNLWRRGNKVWDG